MIDDTPDGQTHGYEVCPPDRERLLGPEPDQAQAAIVSARRRVDPRAFARRDDFATDAPAPKIAGGSIYALDAPGGTVTLCDVEYRDLAGRPFAYATQAERAHVVEDRPIGSLPLTDRPVIGLFSIGRCGSTLLSRVLAAAGGVVLSELDPFTALGPLARRWPADADVQDRLSGIAARLTGHVARHAPPGPLVLKFRSQANQAVGAICAENMRPVLLVRDFSDWAASNARHFPEDPLEGRIDALAHGLRAMADLSLAPRVLDYATLLSDPVKTAALCLGAPVPADRHAAIRACLGRDSQKGTALEVARADVDADHLARAATLWSERRDPSALARLGLSPELRPE